MPLTKEMGYVLSIDPGSNACGVSLWHDGIYLAGDVLKSANTRDPYSKRVQDIVAELHQFLFKHIPGETIDTVVCEGVRARIVQVALGAILTHGNIRATLSPKDSFVESTSWKSWAKKHGATGPLKDIKGMKALRETIGFVGQYNTDSDDVADSILIYFTWRDRC